jgi:hypothetical protein
MPSGADESFFPRRHLADVQRVRLRAFPTTEFAECFLFPQTEISCVHAPPATKDSYNKRLGILKMFEDFSRLDRQPFLADKHKRHMDRHLGHKFPQSLYSLQNQHRHRKKVFKEALGATPCC